MKKLSLLALTILFFAGVSNAQSAKNITWPEMTAFQSIKDANFTPAEKGNLAPLKANVAQIYRTAKVWMGSAVPAGFNEEKTKAAIKDLNIKCHDIWAQTEAKASDKQLKQLVKEANNIYNKIVTDCRTK